MPANIHDVGRLIGKAALLLRVGPTHADSLLFRSLVGLGVLAQLPSERPLADEIADRCRKDALRHPMSPTTADHQPDAGPRSMSSRHAR